MSPCIELNVLGRLGIRSESEPVELRSKKARALLAYLAVESGRSITRERLAALLWGGTRDERARHNVRQALSKIRNACGPIVKSDGDTVEIDQAACKVDVVELERLAKSDDPKSLSTCLDLNRGDLLDGLRLSEPEFEEWLRDARERLRGIACETSDRLTGMLIDGRKDGEAMDVLGRRLAMDPACEPAHRTLMELLANNGRRSDALRQYQTCVEALERELDAEPSPETKAAYNAILNIGGEEVGSTAAGRSSALAPLDSDRPMVAVLPFESLSGEDDAYFADGITEDITTALSCFHSLQVIARGSSFLYRRRDVPEHEIAAALGAQFLVRGSVQRAGNRVRINVRLLDGTRGLNLWGHRYDRELEDVFEVQDEITATVVSTLAGRVEEARLSRVHAAPVERLEAYDILLRGKYHHHRFTAEDCRTCIDMFDRAIERDPNYAVAHAWLACGLGQAMVFHLDENAKLVDQAQAAAERGLELDENESECHRVLAQVFLSRGDLQRSLWHQERALFLNPNDDRSVCSMGEILTFAGRAGEGEQWVRKAIRLNPYHPQRYWTHLARALFHLRRFDEALRVLDQIGRPRIDDLTYGLAASVRIGEPSDIRRRSDALRIAFPEFEPETFVGSLPYERTEDLELVLGALKDAGTQTRRARVKRPS
jgi:adenylate cyclase